MSQGAPGILMYPWHAETRAVFAAYVNGGRVPHALLVSGPKGCGKLELARGIARELLCLEGAAEGCGSCRSCELLKGGAHPDFRDITFELNKEGRQRDVIRVGQIRRLIEALYKTTTVGERKVAIIHPAERMNQSAANALLKTLEEPVGNTVLILVAHDAGWLPATVRSRCQRLTVPLPPGRESARWLADSLGIENALAEEALRAAAGRPLEAQGLLEAETLEQYRGTIRLLEKLRRGGTSDGRALAAMSDLDPVNVWTWLSLRCAQLMREALTAEKTGGDLRPLADLQRQADRNRMLAGTPVRKDLLLRDWLIQWKNLPASLPPDHETQEA